MDSMGTADIGAARLRKTEKSYLPQVDQITARVGYLLDRRGRVDAVLIEQVNIVGAKPAQGAFHLLPDADLLTRSLGARHY
jgi:hypothetical protein